MAQPEKNMTESQGSGTEGLPINSPVIPPTGKEVARAAVPYVLGEEAEPDAGEGVTATVPQGEISQGVAIGPNVVIASERRQRGILIRRSPQPQVLADKPEDQSANTSRGVYASPEYDANKLDQYQKRQEGDYEVLIDPATNKAVARFRQTNSSNSSSGSFTPDFDPRRTDYQRSEDGDFIVLTDPHTGNVVARQPKADVKEFERRRREREEFERRQNSGGGSGGGGGGGRLAHEEEPPEPPEGESLEYEASAERGRAIAKEIIKWEALKTAGKYAEVDWGKLNKAYQEQRRHMEAVRIVGLRLEQVRPASSVTDVRAEVPKIDITKLVNKEGKPLPTPQKLLEDYLTKPDIDIDEFERQADLIFEQAKRVGLLTGLDEQLATIWEKDIVVGIHRELTAAEIMSGSADQRSAGVDRRIHDIFGSLTDLFRARRLSDRGISRLEGVWNLYWQRARERFILAIENRDVDGVTQHQYLNHEFHLGQGHEGRVQQEETYWRTSMGYYVEVYAQTEEEFMVAADSYITRLEAITAAPQKLFQEVEQFVSILYKSEGAKKVSTDFLNRLVMGIEARLGVFGADHSNELYHGDFYKQYMDYINKDGKGPARWLELVRSLDGQVAASLWMLDKDPRWEILFSLFGARGQLAKASNAQRTSDGKEGLFAQVKDILIEELMGVRLKEYNPKDRAALMRNLTRFTSDKKFTAMFEGLYKHDPKKSANQHGDANIKIYELLKDRDDHLLTAEQRRIKRLGRIQKDLRSKELGGNGLESLGIRVKKAEHVVEEAKGSGDDNKIKEAKEALERIEADEKFYEKEKAKAEKAFEIAWEIYGALGEKSKRAGGVFTVPREVNNEKFQDFVPIQYAEKFVTFAETMTKIKYRDDAGIWGDGAALDEDVIAKITAENAKNLPQDPNVLQNMTGEQKNKLLNANFKALYRYYMVEKVRNGAIADFKKDGFEAKLLDEKGQQMKLKRPKENPDTGEIMKDSNGKIIVEEVDVDFYTASHHIYGDWTSHTYWSYQEEDRHLVLSPASFKNARRIINGELRPEDLQDPWAIQLLILDPTLCRVRRLSGRGKHWEERERKLTMAAVEDSYQSHWRISRELHRVFFPELATPTRDINIYYGLQDYGGYRKMIESYRARAAEDPERYMRRGRRLLPDLHIPAAALSEIWGQGTSGSLGVFRMLGTPIYRMGGTFALDKFAAQSEVAGKLYSALFNTQDNNEAEIIEGLLLKLTNDADVNLQPFMLGGVPSSGDWSASDPKAQLEFMSAIRKSFGRLEKYLKKLVVMETLIRNANGAQWLEKVDILKNGGVLSPEFVRKLDSLPDITKDNLTTSELAKFIEVYEQVEEETLDGFSDNFNAGDDETPGIDEGKISTNTGSGRHSAKLFFDTFMQLILDKTKRGGGDLYKGERFIMEHLKDKVIVYDSSQPKGRRVTNDTIAYWLFNKIVAT